MLRNLIKYLIIFIPSLLILVLVFVNINKLDYAIDKKEKSDELIHCKDLNYEKSLLLHPSNFSSNFILEIKFKSQRAWRKNLLENLITSEKNKDIAVVGWRNFATKSKRFESLVIFEIPKKIKCYINARIRDHGDLLHDQKDTSLLPSLNVHLSNGNIFGITKFILFLPQARNFDNEIFATNLYREVGLLAPRTTYVNVKNKSQLKKFIFQEKIHKEFLESNSLREGPIIEGDERFAFIDDRHYQDLSKNKIVNDNWSQKNEVTYSVSELSLSWLNHLSQLHHLNFEKEKTDNLDYNFIGNNFLKINPFSNLDVFDALSVALGSDHMQPKNERRFYFDPLNKKFYPIYYDGMVSLLDKKSNQYADGKSFIIPSVQKGADEAYKLIEKIDKLNLLKRLNSSGLKMKSDELNILLSKISNNLYKLKNKHEDEIFSLEVKKDNEPYISSIKGYSDKINRRLVFYSENFENFESCDIFGNNCKTIDIDKKDKKKLINQSLKDEKKNFLIFIGKINSGNGNENWFYQKFNLKYHKQILDNGVNILKVGNPEIIINRDTNEISILKRNFEDRVIFFGGSLRNWNVKFDDRSQENISNLNSIDYNNLTGCVNFYDIKVHKVSVSSYKSTCEDAINFVRVDGNLKKVEILNSNFDGMDADFSRIIFKNVTVKNSKNDCLDFSYGEYSIYNSNLNKCGDKGISVGENSLVDINNIIIENSNIAIVSKDYSNVELSNSIINKTKTCFQAYNKKPEFAGGFLKVRKTKCNNFKKYVEVEASSKVIID